MATEISVEEFKKIRNSVTVIDVREPNEPGSIEGAIKIPLSVLSVECVNIPKDKEIVCYCQRGRRSMIAADMLITKGFKVRSLTGGIEAYQKTI